MVALAPLNAHMLGPTTEFADMVADLCEMFLGVLQQSIDELSDQLLASLEVGDLDDLYARAAPVPPDALPLGVPAERRAGCADADLRG